jgi:hypothetical protein
LPYGNYPAISPGGLLIVPKRLNETNPTSPKPTKYNVEGSGTVVSVTTRVVRPSVLKRPPVKVPASRFDPLVKGALLEKPTPNAKSQVVLPEPQL